MADIRTVLFDLDGTLIDSIGLILASYRHTLQTHGIPAVADAEWLKGVGTPLRVQLAPWAREPGQMDALVATYREYNLANHDRMITAYPGVVRVVRATRELGLRTGLVTSKNQEGARRGLRLVGLEESIEVLVCADDVRRPKPDHEPVLRALELLGAEASSTLFVGDSIHDLHAGRGAGVRTGAVLWGPFSRADLEPAAPDYWLERVEDLARILGLVGC